MYRVTLPMILCFFAIGVYAQGQSDSYTADPDRRKALLREFAVQERGEITVIEPSTNADGSVVIGYASGAVLICFDNETCSEFGNTPNAPVEQIAISKKGDSEIIWATYRQGAVYRCTDDICNKQLWDVK